MLEGFDAHMGVEGRFQSAALAAAATLRPVCGETEAGFAALGLGPN